jgi:GNAT superfamily N-acetyltransferase
MAVNYRLATQEDVSGISAVFADAYNDLYQKRGLLETPINPIPPNPIFAFQIRKTPNAFWVAEEDEKVVGSDSFVRGSFWFFSWLFISPAHQGRDIGRNLLERTLGSWEDVKITNRATITFAFNPVSQSLYMRYGMYPREPVYYVECPRKTIEEEGRRAEGLSFEPLEDLGDGPATLRQMDESALGFSLDWHHEFFLETKARCYVFKERNDPVGYAYVRPNGGVGPVAVESEVFTRPVLETALSLSAEQGVEKVRFYTPGSNIHAIDLALKYRMWFDPLVFMSTKSFASWGNYIFHSAALM